VNYYELFKKYVNDSGLTLGEIADALDKHGYNVSKGYISMLQNGKTPNPATAEFNRAFAEITGGDVEYLLTLALIEKAPPEIKEKFIRMNKLKELNKELQEVTTVNERTSVYMASGEVKPVPLLKSVSNNENFNDSKIGVEYVKTKSILNQSAFSLVVMDDSMSGDYIIKGDIVICVETDALNSNEIGVVSIRGEAATIKRMNCQNDVCMIIPSNPKLQPTLEKLDQVKVFGKVIEVRRITTT
jgi:SOS-response transcriptional repressor LexA